MRSDQIYPIPQKSLFQEKKKSYVFFDEKPSMCWDIINGLPYFNLKDLPKYVDKNSVIIAAKAI